MHRLKAGEAASDRTFCALVVSVCAATVATLRRADYHPVTVEGCLDFIEDHHLLDHGIRKPAYSLDWCIAMYNIGTSASSMNENGLGDMGSFHGMSEAAAGARFLAYYRMADLDMSEQQLLKRLFWLIFAAYWYVASPYPHSATLYATLGSTSMHDGGVLQHTWDDDTTITLG